LDAHAVEERLVERLDVGFGGAQLKLAARGDGRRDVEQLTRLPGSGFPILVAE